jgi:putative salt-induced outer membrane protein
MQRSRTPVLVLAGILPFAGTAMAQEGKAPPPPPPLWSGKAELSFVSTSGNTDTQTLGAGGEVEYQPGVWSGKAKFDYIRSESDGKENARSLAFLLRGARKIFTRAEVFAQAGYLKNTFAGIDRRLAGEAGLAYELLAPGAHSLKAQAGLGYTKETRVGAADRSFATAGAGLLYKWALSKSAEFSNETSYRRDLKTSEDWLFANTASVSAGMTTVLSLKVSWALTKANDPPPGFKKTDTITKAAVVAKF